MRFSLLFVLCIFSALFMQSTFAAIVIYDLLGKEIETIVNEQLNAGTYAAEWYASDYPSGIYYYKFSAGDYTETKKMVLIK